MRVYLAGKMRGLENFGAEHFRRATAALRALGHEVVSPVEETEAIYGEEIYKNNPDGDEDAAGIDGRVVFLNDLTFICKHADAVVLLPNWVDSKGARAERAVAEALGLKVIEL